MQFCMRALRRVVLTSIALALAMFVVPQVHGQAGGSGTVVDQDGPPRGRAGGSRGADTRAARTSGASSVSMPPLERGWW
jgi:hypothetical protein